MKRIDEFIDKYRIEEIIYCLYGIGVFLTGYISKLSCLYVAGIFFLVLLLLKLIVRKKHNKLLTVSEEKAYFKEIKVCHGIGYLLLPFGLILVIFAIQMVANNNNYFFSKIIAIINAFFVIYYSVNAIVYIIYYYKNKTVYGFIKNIIKSNAAIMSTVVLQLTRFNYVFSYKAIENYDVAIDGIVGCLVGVSIIITSVYMIIYQGKDDKTFVNVRPEKINTKQKYFFSFLFATILLSFTVIMTYYNIFDITDNLFIQMVLRDKTKLVPSWFESLMYGICIFSSYISLNFHEKRLSSVISAVVAIFSFLFIVLISLSGYHFHFFAFIVCIATMIFTFVFQELILGKLNNKKIESTLNMYVDSNVVEEMSKVRQRNMAKEIKRKEIAVLFVDVRGFTSYSEKNDPAKVVEELNKYFLATTTIIQKWGGTLDKYIGDAVMAIFNAPNDDEDYIYKSICAAKEIIDENKKNKGKLKLGVGVNVGEAIVGNIGSNMRMDYTAIGDVVNTASRIEGIADKNEIIVTDAVVKELRDRFIFEEMGKISLKGKSKPVKAYRVK